MANCTLRNHQRAAEEGEGEGDEDEDEDEDVYDDGEGRGDGYVGEFFVGWSRTVAHWLIAWFVVKRNGHARASVAGTERAA
jgi:hypothetical protein